MERALILLFTTVILFGAPGINASNQEFNITRTGCGVTKLCVETPANCDPAGNSACLFASVKAETPMAPTGTNMAFQLSGNSSGFIALGLTQKTSEGNTMLFACAQNSNGSFFFQTATRNNTNNMLTPASRTVTEGKAKGDMIQCEFNLPNLSASNTRSAQDTTFVLLLGSGTVNGDTLDNFKTFLTTNALNLDDPKSNAATTEPPSGEHTTRPPTGASCALHSHAVLLLLSMLTLSVLRTA